MRIAMVTETYPPEVNGVARTVGLMVEGLRQRGHSIQLVRPRQNGHDHASSLENFAEVLLTGIPIPRYTQLKMGMPSRRRLERAATDPDYFRALKNAVSSRRRLFAPAAEGSAVRRLARELGPRAERFRRRQD